MAAAAAAASAPSCRGMEAAAAAIARGSTNPLAKQFVGLHSRSRPSASSCSCCISWVGTHRPSSSPLQLSRSTQQQQQQQQQQRGPSSLVVVQARKRSGGRVASRRAPASASKERSGGKGREGGSVALKDPESASAVPVLVASVNRNTVGGFVALRAPESAPDLASSSSCSSSILNSHLIGGLIALRIPDTVIIPSYSEPNSAPAAGEVRLAPAEDSKDGLGDILAGGTLSATLSSLIRVQEAKLFRPSIFNISKLRVLLLGKHDDERPLQHPRIYTLTHSDLTAMITLAVAREINKAQLMGWYSKLQRDEVVAEWRRTQGQMSLHVHCHISGTNFLHRLIAKLRFYIFQKELPLVLEAFRQGDRNLFEMHPELLNAPVWVYFHSHVENYNRVESWGPLINPTKSGLQIRQWGPTDDASNVVRETEQHFPGAATCPVQCECCSRHETVIPIPESLYRYLQQSRLQRQSSAKGASQSSSFRLC